MDAPPPVRYRVSIVPTQPLAGKVVPKNVTFSIALVGSDSPVCLFEAQVAKENLDCCLALQRLGSIIVEADEDMALRKGDWRARVISAALRGAFPKPQ